MTRVESVLRQVSPIFEGLADTPLTRKLLSDLMATVAAAFSKGRLSREQVAALWASVSPLEGKSLPRHVMRRNAARLVANWHFIHDGMEIPEWDGTAIDCSVVFIGVARVSDGESLPRYVVKTKLKTGLGAGIIQCAILSSHAVAYFLGHVAGGGCTECAPEEISGMHCDANVSVSQSLLHINGWRCTQAQRSHNNKLTALRRSAGKCDLGVPCNVCGRDITECPLAVWLPGSNA